MRCSPCADGEEALVVPCCTSAALVVPAQVLPNPSSGLHSVQNTVLRHSEYSRILELLQVETMRVCGCVRQNKA